MDIVKSLVSNKKQYPIAIFSIVVIVSEIFTFLLNVGFSYYLWGYINTAWVQIGAINAFLVSILVSIVIISLLKERCKLKTEVDKLRLDIQPDGYYGEMEESDHIDYFKSLLQVELDRSARYDFTLSLMSIRLTNYDSILESYGKENMIYILKEMVSILCKNKRPYDLVGRYTTRFILCFNQILPGSSDMIIKRLEQKIKDHSFQVKLDESMLTTISVNVKIDVKSIEIAPNKKGISLKELLNQI